ncbi:MAG: histidinol-phosphate transaminase, partial [Candidatus Omnitrophica bacterium]|nr:histidinol-phosphate transaminase [Candidatus Omnitrophota bacterium]
EPGKPIEEVQRELGLKEVIKLASNENALGPSPKAVAAIRKNLKNINRYPDSASYYLKRGLSKRLGVSAENLVIGNGSDELIVLALRAFVDEGDEVIIADKTFLIYEIASQAVNARIVRVPMKDFKYDLGAMKERVSGNTRIVFIANPDNPNGTYVTGREVSAFMKGLPDDTLVFFDEAYYEFGASGKDYPDTMKYLDRGNVVIARTFSKAYGLSGLRVGYAIAGKELVNCMNKVREPFNVNILAQTAASAALDDREFLNRTLANTRRGKDFLYKEFDRMGLGYVPSATNFILVNVGRDSKEVFKGLLSRGIIVRDMKAWGLDTYIRVTIGTPLENRKFIRALKELK